MTPATQVTGHKGLAQSSCSAGLNDLEQSGMG